MPRMPQITAYELIRFLKAQGFIADRQSGSHLTLWNEVNNISVTVPIQKNNWGQSKISL
jgi:predicted RNA binding protein YcfA (HicA-like mRNA interferase family)